MPVWLVYLTYLLVLGLGVVLGRFQERQKAPPELRLAIVALNIARIIRDVDPTMDVETAITMAKEVAYWAQEQTT